MGGIGRISHKMLARKNSIYVGEHVRSLDERGRVLLPAKWRFAAEERDMYIAIPNPAKCITVCPPNIVDKLQEKAAGVSLGDKKGQKTLTKLFSKADQLVCDAHGRVSINKMLMEHASLEKELIMVGNFVTFSIWNPEQYAQYLRSNDDTEDEFSQNLIELGL